jgi:hypothetical protein
MAGKRLNIDRVVLQIAEKVRDETTKQGNIPFLSGDLRKSITVEKLGKGKASVGSNLAYARAVHDGRPPLTIYPNVRKNPPLGHRKHRNPRKARLKFKVGGKVVFARKVRQPARKPDPYLRRGAEKVQRDGYDFLDQYLTERVSEQIAESIKKKIVLNMNF